MKNTVEVADAKQKPEQWERHTVPLVQSLTLKKRRNELVNPKVRSLPVQAVNCV